MTHKLLIGAALSVLLTTPSLADSIRIGDLMIHNPVARETAPGAKVGAGYLMIKNVGSQSERLLGGTAGFAGKVEVHTMKMENQVMKMQRLANGLEIPPNTTVKLVPGGNHIMFMRLHEQLKSGDKRKATLNFATAGEVQVTFDVKSIAQTMKLKHSH